MRVSVAAILLAFAGLLVFAAPSEARQQRLLVLHSYHYGYRWSDSIQKGIEKVFANISSTIEMRVEYMDTKRDDPGAAKPALRAFYGSKYRDLQPDVIIAADDNALRFLLDLGEDLFPRVPVVFCGINGYDPRMLHGRSRYTGVRESFDIAGNVELINRLHPDAPVVAVISGATSSGEINLKRFRRIAPAFEPRMRFEILAALSTEQLTARLAELPANAVILSLGFGRDAKGRAYEVPDGVQVMLQGQDLPVYGMWDFILGTGAVGGRVVSGERQGEAAARMVEAILGGRAPSTIPVQLDSPNMYMFDARALEHYGISESDLPVGSVVLFRPDSFYSRNKALIWAVSLAFTMLLALLATMTVNMIRRRRLEQRLKESQERYLLMARGANDGLWDLNLPLDELYLSGRNMQMLGLEAQSEWMQAERGFWIARVHPDDRDMLWKTPEMVLESEENLFAMEYRVRHKDGHYIWVLSRGIGQCDNTGQVVRLAGTHTDITATRQAKEELADMNRNLEDLVHARTRDLDIKARELEYANARLTELDRLKSAFLTSVSHELRTPLTSVLGFAKLIHKDVQRVLDASEDAKAVRLLHEVGDRVMENLVIIVAEGERLTRLINDVLDLDRIEKGVVMWHDRTVDVEAVVRKAIDAIRGMVEQNPEVELRMDLQLPLPRILIDPDRLHQLLLNLLSNAVKFTEQGWIEVQCGIEDDLLHLRVRDTGPGIPETELEAVFDKFHQGRFEDSAYTDSRGTGLGLSISRNIARHYGGDMWAESELGYGSTFHLTLPMSLAVRDGGSAVHGDVSAVPKEWAED